MTASFLGVAACLMSSEKGILVDKEDAQERGKMSMGLSDSQVTQQVFDCVSSKPESFVLI